MSGIYIHIPFCKKACHYCNFHFSTSLRLKGDMTEAICKEIMMRKDYLTERNLSSIYFGGGTPSLLDEVDLNKILDTLSKYYIWEPSVEITLEANPDDINTEQLKLFKSLHINRLSIGVQSFFDDDLKWMNRSHSADDAKSCILLAQDHGFENLTIDLIYGSPSTSDTMWERNIQQAIDYNIPHISCYCLTVEEKTALHHKIKVGKSSAPDQLKANQQFDILIEMLSHRGYDHYEISNFGMPDHHAVHNTNYWKGQHYLGLGPSAHSYNGQSRSWNIAHNKKYIDNIAMGHLPLETEILTDADRYNEYIMTGLRTMWGITYEQIKEFGPVLADHFAKQIIVPISSRMIRQVGSQYTLTHEGKFFADRVAMDLFWVE